MILGNRQIEFGTASVPEIKRATKVEIKGYESIVEAFTEALMNKMSNYYKHKEFRTKLYKEIIATERDMFKDCIEQTITFLKYIHAIKPVRKINKIKLWKDAVQMHPFYEGINLQLKSMLIKQHFPRMAEAINKGAVYSHYSLTEIGEAVLYKMEYFQKKGLFNESKEVIQTPEVKKWIEEYQEYLIKNKDKIKQEEKAREEYRKEDQKRLKESMEKLEVSLR
mgnify:CR=1 FL=1